MTQTDGGRFFTAEPPGKPCIHTHTIKYYSAIRKNEIMLSAATQMGLEIIRLSEVSQKEKDKYHMIPLICGI